VDEAKNKSNLFQNFNSLSFTLWLRTTNAVAVGNAKVQVRVFAVPIYIYQSKIIWFKTRPTRLVLPSTVGQVWVMPLLVIS
jgi:hypothetical protein